MEKEHRIEFRLKAENIADLLRGKKLVYETTTFSVTVYPENYGYFIDPEKMHFLRRMIAASGISEANNSFIQGILDEANKPITPTS